MNIVVNPELKAYIDPLTGDEYAALERSILAEGCRDALVLWGEVLVDGHNRYGICQKHDLAFQTVQNTRFQSMQDVHLWMIEQHLGRRSVSDFQRGVLALRQKDILTERQASAQAPAADSAIRAPLSGREAIARAARLSSSQVVLIEKIQKQAAPEVLAAVKCGSISINAAAAVASLPAEEQVAAAQAGPDELKQAAKRVREARRKPQIAAQTLATNASAPESPAPAALYSLQQRVAELTTENDALRQQVALLQSQLAAG